MLSYLGQKELFIFIKTVLTPMMDIVLTLKDQEAITPQHGFSNMFKHYSVYWNNIYIHVNNGHTCVFLWVWGLWDFEPVEQARAMTSTHTKQAATRQKPRKLTGQDSGSADATKLVSCASQSPSLWAPGKHRHAQWEKPELWLQTRD